MTGNLAGAGAPGNSSADRAATSVSRERMGLIPPDEQTPAQKTAWAEVERTRGPIGGPFAPLLRSPEFLTRLQHVGAYLRFESALPAYLRELVILLVARAWTQNFEWLIHAPIARKAGLSGDVIAAIAIGTRPAEMPDDVALVYDFCSELFHNRSVCDAVYERAIALFGEHGVIDMTGIAGYYTTLAMVMNVARTTPPSNGDAGLMPLP
jgi:4-carboxymuconolactone decarboxylase